MRATLRACASISALALLFVSGCAIGEPVVDREAAVPTPPPIVPSCRGSMSLCGTELEESRAIAPRPLSDLFCVPPDPDGSIAEGHVPSGCEEPVLAKDWRNADVLLWADKPREVVISGERVFNMRIRLEGPVTLVLRGLEQLTNVELATTSTEATVVLDDVMGLGMNIGDATTPFAGHVVARHSRLERLSMDAASFELDSAIITESFVAADFLNSADGVFRDVALDLGDALFAPSHLERSEIVSCRTLGFFGGSLLWTRVSRCDSDEPTRIYEVDVFGSILDGLVSAEGGEFQATQFGRYQDSEYVLRYVAVHKGSMFCDHAVRLKSNETIYCSGCTEAAFGSPQDDACNLDSPAVDSARKANSCEAVNLEERCKGPPPDRLRPISDYEFEL